MNTAQLVEIERGLWLKPGPWLAATALPRCWFALPDPIGLTDRNALQKQIGHMETGLDIVDARVELITDDVAILVYRASSRQEPSGPRYLCSSSYVKGRRSWSLAHHQRTRVGATSGETD